MELRFTTQLMAVMSVLSLCHVGAIFSFHRLSNVHAQPRCTAASKPCRIRAVMEGDAEAGGQSVITSHPCSCPESKPCSEDFETNADKVIERELITDGNINMTLSMMFCDAVQPQRVCNPAEIALKLTGWSHVLTEVDFITCTCSDARPLVLHQKWYGQDYRLFQTFVCSSDKRRCNTRRRSKDACMEVDPETHAVNYPCKCPAGNACSPSPYNSVQLEYTCQRPLSRATRSG